nr:hypothetical protein Itr_chr02CG00620 [Ipomoea trifida]
MNPCSPHLPLHSEACQWHPKQNRYLRASFCSSIPNSTDYSALHNRSTSRISTPPTRWPLPPAFLSNRHESHVHSHHIQPHNPRLRGAHMPHTLSRSTSGEAPPERQKATWCLCGSS